MDDPLERVRAVYAYFDLPIGVEVLVCTGGELIARLGDGDPSWASVWTSGQSLLD